VSGKGEDALVFAALVIPIPIVCERQARRALRTPARRVEYQRRNEPQSHKPASAGFLRRPAV